MGVFVCVRGSGKKITLTLPPIIHEVNAKAVILNSIVSFAVLKSNLCIATS